METNAKILVVDPDPSVREFLVAALGSRFALTTATTPAEAAQSMASSQVDLVLAAVELVSAGSFPDLEQASGPAVVLMSPAGGLNAAARIPLVRNAGILRKPFGKGRLDHAVNRALKFRELERENRLLRRNLRGEALQLGLVGSNPAIQQLREKISMVGGFRGPFLIEGESGTGKGLMAQAVHRAAAADDGGFHRVNCAAIPEPVLEAELFGYDKGRQDGMRQSQMGKLVVGRGGTLLLDEENEMPLGLQAHLARVLAERRFATPGSGEWNRLEVRLIATSHRDLKHEVDGGRFLADLYVGLNVIPLRSPPLRDRKDDIPALARHFLRKFSAANGRPVPEITESALRVLTAMDWPGNVRQLRNVVERAVIMEGKGVLDETVLGLAREMDSGDVKPPLTADMTLKEMERELILRKLVITGGNRTRAARELGISVRTLRNKLNLYSGMGLEVPR